MPESPGGCGFLGPTRKFVSLDSGARDRQVSSGVAGNGEAMGAGGGGQGGLPGGGKASLAE